MLTTGQAAKVCSVTPDTILKWIRSGRLPARRTPGGHHRIDRRDLERVVGEAQAAPQTEQPSRNGRQFQYCWEFKSKGDVLNGCKQCIVYSLRAQRCYEVAKLAPEGKHSGLFCEGSCTECDYYRHVRDQNTNVLVVSDDSELVSELREAVTNDELNLEFADCEYTCSAVVDGFRPDFVVVDCKIGQQRSLDICRHLDADPRVPFARVILTGARTEFPEDCEEHVFAKLEKPFTFDDLTRCTDGFEGGSRRS